MRLYHESHIDPATGKVYGKELVPATKVKEYLNYSDLAGNEMIEDALSEIGIIYNSKNGSLSIDEKKFKAADKDKVRNLLGRDGSFGQRIRSDSTLIQSVAATAVRNSTTSAYGRNGLYGNNSLYGLMNSYGLGSSYGLTGNYGLSSFLGNWLA